jgi:membrane protease YdiL (CAAX protease family)
MSEDTSKANEKKSLIQSDFGITWTARSAILVAVITYLAAQFLGAELISTYPALRHWSHEYTLNWINNSVIAQFFYVLFAEGFTVILLGLFIKWRKGSWRAIGLKKPKILADLAWALTGVAVYFPLYIVVVSILGDLIKSLSLNQQQQVGFSQSTTGWALVLVFLSLVILPPIVEEIMFRGFLFSGLKKSLPKIWAILLTSLIFASPHLLEGTSGGALWIAGIDTFVLSLVLCWLREKTGRLYAGMGLHALKNFVAFASLFLFHVH